MLEFWSGPEPVGPVLVSHEGLSTWYYFLSVGVLVSNFKCWTNTKVLMFVLWTGPSRTIRTSISVKLLLIWGKTFWPWGNLRLQRFTRRSSGFSETQRGERSPEQNFLWFPRQRFISLLQKHFRAAKDLDDLWPGWPLTQMTSDLNDLWPLLELQTFSSSSAEPVGTKTPNWKL